MILQIKSRRGRGKPRVSEGREGEWTSAERERPSVVVEVILAVYFVA